MSKPPWTAPLFWMTTLITATAIGTLPIGCEEASPQAGADTAIQPTVTETSSNPAPSTESELFINSNAGDAVIPMPPNTTTGNGPQLTYTRTIHDFGKMWDIRTHQTSFPFRNTGTETLIIEKVKADCGCTALELDKKIFEPGEGSEIKVKFTPKGHGKQTKRITITSNAANGSLQRLTIKADIVPVVTIEPSVYLNFGVIPLNEESTRIITLQGRYPEVIVDSINAPNSRISARLVEDDEVTDIFLPSDPRQSFKIAVTMHKYGRWGGFYSVLNINSRSIHPETGEEIKHTIAVHVNANVFGEIHGSDTMFRVGSTPLRQTFQKVVTLTRPSGVPFTITGAYLERTSFTGMNLTVDPINQSGVEGYRLTLTGDPGDYQGPVKGRVLVMTNIAGEEQFYIPINGMVRQIGR